MKKIKKEKLSLQKATVVELNSTQMHIINGGSEYNTVNDPDTMDTIGSDTKVNSGPRLTYTTCSSVRSH